MKHIHKALGVVALFGLLVISGCVASQPETPQTPNEKPLIPAVPISEEEVPPVKEFSMDSFLEITDGKFFPQFSVKEITVKKGDLVRIKINTISGEHNFKIDEFDVFSETPTGEETIVEFVAAETGEFVYYCAKPNHRANGHWGTLKVTE